MVSTSATWRIFESSWLETFSPIRNVLTAARLSLDHHLN